MARRVAERELRDSEGLPLDPLGPISSIKVTKDVKFHKTYGGVYSMQWNYVGTLLAVGYGSGGVELYDQTGALVKELRPCRQGGYAIMVLRFHPKNDDLLYAGTAEGHIYVYKISSGEQVEKIEESGNEINTMDFSVDGFNFITGGKDLNVRVYETKNNKLSKTFLGYDKNTFNPDKSTVANTQRVFSIKCHHNNEYLFITGGWDNHIKIWDIRDNDGIKRDIRGPHIAGDSLDLKGNNILAGQWAALHAVQEYDYTSGKVVKELNFPHKDGAFIYACSYLNDNAVIAGGSGTNSVEVIEIDTNRHCGGYKTSGPVHCCDSANNGRVMSVGGSASSFAILEAKV